MHRLRSHTRRDDADEETAKRIQLLLEYAPKPPFDAGDPEMAGSGLSGSIHRARKPIIERAETVADRFASRAGST